MSGPLKNARHERFVQALAKGESASEAYKTAGYAPNDGNAIRLKGNEKIAARLEELLGRAAERTEITVAHITGRLLKIAEKGEKASEAPLLSVARASLMDAAKLNGLVTDKTEHRLADDQLESIVGLLGGEDALRRLKDELAD